MNSDPLILLNNLSQCSRKDNKLEKIINLFQERFHLIPRIGVEIEFYLTPNIDIKKFEKSLDMEVQKERGENQYEIFLPPATDLVGYINEINELKHKVVKIANMLNGQALFASKPFTNDYGSSLHYHIDFLNVKNDSSKFDLSLAASSLCQFMLQTFLIFMPDAKDYLRISQEYMSPTHVSYGGNNRTVAIRIPDSYPLRVEHRLSSPQADIYLGLIVILKSILLGYSCPASIKNYPKIYGKAYDLQYNLSPLPQNIQEAVNYFDINFFNNQEDFLIIKK